MAMQYYRLNRQFKCGGVLIRVTGWSVTGRDGRPCFYRGTVTLPSGKVWRFEELGLGVQDYTDSVDTTPMLRKVAEAAMGWADASIEDTGVEGQPSRDFTEELEMMAHCTYTDSDKVYNVTR